MSAELDGFLGIINKLLAFLGSSVRGRPPHYPQPDRPPGTKAGSPRRGGPGLALSRIRFGRESSSCPRAAPAPSPPTLDGECDEVLWFEIAQVGLPHARARVCASIVSTRR